MNIKPYPDLINNSVGALMKSNFLCSSNRAGVNKVGNMTERVIWTYGWGQDEIMPPYIKACHYTMKANSDCNVIVVTPDDINKYIKDILPMFFNLIPPIRQIFFG